LANDTRRICEKIRQAETLPAGFHNEEWGTFMKLRNQKTGIVAAFPYLLPSLLGMALFSVLPIVASLCISMTRWSGMTHVSIFHGFFTFVKENFIGFQNYAAVFQEKEIWTVLSHNAYFLVLYMPLMLCMSLILAVIVGSDHKAVGVYRVIYYIPVLTSWVAGALIWKWVLSSQYGPINDILGFVGIKGPAWLQSEIWAMPSIVLASVWKDMGFYGMIFLGGLQSISPEYYEAAKIDGASAWQRFKRITLPLLSPTTFYVMILSLINAFQIFPQVMVMTTDAGPNGATQVMVERIYKFAFSFGKMGYAASYSWILFAIIFAITIFQNLMQRKWVHYE